MPATGLIEFELWSRYQYTNVEVAGESYNEASIREVFRGQGASLATGESKEIDAVARLVPDPGNRHDRNAVEVLVAGHKIGFLPREVAASHGKVMIGLVTQGFQPVTRCRIWAYETQEWKGVDRRGRDVYSPDLQVRASLVLDDPELCVPVNLPPVGQHRLLPQGAALQIRGEEDHMDVLSPLVGPAGTSWVYATLGALQTGSGRSEKTIVEISVDRRPIGQLTPAMSAHYLPTIAHLAERRTATAAKVLLKGNSIKIEAVLHATRAHELDAAWFEDDQRGAAQSPDPRNLVPALPAVANAARAETPVSQQSGGATKSIPETVVIPPKPTRIAFAVPPGWPPPPPLWEPEPGWTPPPEWPRPPTGWNFWVSV